MARNFIIERIIENKISTSELYSWYPNSLVGVLDQWAISKFQNFDTDTVRAVQFRKAKKIIQFAYRNIPFWSDYFGRIGFNPEIMESVDDLKKIPPVSREFIKQSSIEYSFIRAKDSIFDTTSGSTGVPLGFYYSRSTLLRRKSIYLRNLSWVGFNRNNQIVRIMTRDITGLSGIGNFVSCRGPEELEEKKLYIYSLLNQNAMILEGVASSVFYLAQLMEKDGVKFDILAVVITAERLSQGQLSFMESVFGSKIYDCYGTREVDRIAQECLKKEGLHINSDWVYVEIVDETGKSLPSGKSGKIIITTLDNFVTPLIRYELGDCGTILPHLCSCGVSLPLISFEGRTFEQIELPDHTMIHAFEFTGLFNRFSDRILRYQIIQESVDHISVLIIPKYEFTLADQQKVKDVFENKTKHLMHVAVTVTSQVYSLPSGKTAMFINKLR